MIRINSRRKAGIWTLSALFIGIRCLVADPIPLEFNKNAVQFLFTRDGTNYVPLGTCFQVGVTTLHRPKKFWHAVTLRPSIIQHSGYYVTAKHVLFDANGVLRPEIYMHSGTPNGGTTNLILNPSITAGLLRIITNANPSVDLAVMALASGAIPLIPNGNRPKPPDAVNMASFDASIIADKQSMKKRHIREGDEMFFVGLIYALFWVQGKYSYLSFRAIGDALR